MQLNKHWQLLILILILFFGSYLIFNRLAEIPNGLYVDEATTGYNAYSILKTGKDEYGKWYPWAFRFFGSYSPPLYTYLSIPVIAIVGLNVFSVRFISAVSGILSIVVIYFFLSNFSLIKNKVVLPLVGCFLYLITPWSLFYSRAGYEINLAYFLFISGILFFWLGFRKPIFYLFGLIILSVSTYAAHTQFFLFPAFVLLIFIIFYKDFNLKSKYYFKLGILIAVVMQIPHLMLLSSSALFVKNSLFYTSQISNGVNKLSFLPVPLSFAISFLHEFFAQYVTYFSPKSLFYLADSDLQRSLPEISTYYSWMVVPYLIGIYSLWRAKYDQQKKLLIILFFLIPLPVSLSSDPFSTQRALPFLLPTYLIISLGIDCLISKVNFKIWLPIFCLLVLSSLVVLWRSYFVLLPQERARVWGYGFSQLADFIGRNPDAYFIIDQNRIKPIYIELAFFLKIPPEELQKGGDQNIESNYYKKAVFNPEHKFRNIEIRNISWKEDIYRSQILVGDEWAVSENQAREHRLVKLFEIRDPLDSIIFQGFATNPIEKCRQEGVPEAQCIKQIN